MIKVLSIFGTRPEAIKMAPVILELGKHPDIFDSRICVTAQHRQMLDQVLSVFGLVPDIDLDLMRENQTLADLSARALTGLSDVLKDLAPDLVLVQGDTTTVFAASLAAFYQRVPVGHVEAGLRTQDIYNPFPEEVNRRVTDVLTSFYFAPTQTARNALLREGFADERIFVTGNTVIDALHRVVGSEPPQDIQDLLEEIGSRRMILLTAHRRENFGKPLENICTAILEIIQKYPDVVVVYPVHMNPNVRDIVYEQLSGLERVMLIEPQSYQGFVHLMNSATLVLTDSGGIQEEAPALGKPVLVLRKVTERPEAVESGTVKVIGTERKDILRETGLLLDDQELYQQMAAAVSPYGDGQAAERIVKILVDHFQGGS